MHKRYWVAFTILAALPAGAQGTTTPAPGTAVLDERDQLIRQRYEQVLARDPLQDAAFDRVYESYMLSEGVDAWLEKLKPAEGATETQDGLVLRGRILARQFKVDEAVAALSRARELGATGPAFQTLLGRLYYETGNDAEAITLLGAALDATERPEQRSELCRMLGSVYLRSGKRAEAAAVWERIAELNPGDLFALQELAEIYEENRLWDEAIAARKRIVEAAVNDPYRQCHAWRAIGQSLLAKDDAAGAIAAFEDGLALAAPGNWLFDDLKGRLVGVYESRGDLEGLSAYLEARIAQDATDLSLTELLADVSMRRDDTTRAEVLLKEVVARAPGRASALEMLIVLYAKLDRMEDLASTFEVLIAQYPAEPDYLRRLGEAWLEHKSPEKAQATWRRVLGDGAAASNHALLAEWLEGSEFYSEAAAAYEAALAIQPNREWRLRLASLKYDMGEEEAALAAWQASAAPEDTPAAEVAEIAVILLSKEFKAEAEALYLRAMALAPDNLDYVLAYARLLAARGDHEGAATQYARLAGQDHNEYLKNEGERGLLDAYDALGTLDAQRAAWEAAIAQAPDDTAARLKLARLYARLGNRPGVVQLYEACVAIAPERIEFQRLLAAAYTENRQSDKAMGVLEELMARDTSRSQAYLRELLALYGAAGRPAEAVRAAEKLVELSPASPEARTALAQVYLRNGDVEKGLQQYRDLLQLDSAQPACYKEFGDALQQNGKFGEAQEIYRKMLDAAADDATRLDAVGRLAAVYLRNGQRDVLLSEFQRRVSAAPKSLPAYQELAAIYRAAGDLRGALETLERAQGEVEDREEVLRLVMTEAYQAGDHQKVLAAYEELVARSAQPTAYDLDRLASAYAQVGRNDEAQAIWERIARENPDDSAVQLMVARQLEGQGFYDEANDCTERALAIDPYDHDLRFEYAQRLLGFNEVDRALEQMQKILDIGERPEAATAPGAPSAAPSPGPAALNSGMSFQAGSGFGGRSRWRGQTFGELRQQVVQSMVQASRQFEDVKPLLETYRKRIEAQPENIDLRRDYLLICEASNENELALETARALLLLQPDDTTLRWRILGYLQELGRVDEAIAVATELSALPDENLTRQARFTRIRLLAESNRFDEAEAVLAELTTDTPEMAQIYLQVASSFQRASNSDIADHLYQKAAALDSRFRHHALTGRARLLQERGDAKAARDLYIEAVFAPSADDQRTQQAPPGRTPAPLYMPQGARRGRQSGNNVTHLPGFNFPNLDHQRAEALNQAYRLAATPEDFAPVISRLREASAAYATAESDDQRQAAASFTYFLVACLRNTEQESEAIATVQALLAQRPGDSALQNLVLFLLDEQGRFDEMNALYSEVEGANPAVAGDVARARLQLALAKEDTAAIPALFRALPDAVVTGSGRQFGASRASQLNQVVRALENAGAPGEARALLEEELLRSRDAGILTLLSRSFAAEKNYDQAIAYAREAWEKQGGSRVRPGTAQYSMNAMSLQTQGQFGLEMLWNVYREAGREQELIDEFKTRLEGQPASLTLRQSLVGLYMENHQYDLAREAMEKLLELRPNDVPLKVRYAGLLEGNNDPAGALAVLESVASTRPSAARSIAGEIRRLYKDLGKKEELAAMDEKMIREARSAEELQQLARQLAEEGDFLQAAELMQKAQRIEPENTWLNFQIGDYLWQADKKPEAADVYLKFFQPISPQGGIQIDVGRTPEIIQRVDKAGRLEALKAIAAGSVPDPFSARSLKILGALIARHEKRPEDAEQMLKAIAEGAADQQVYGLLADLAEARGDLAGAIQYLEATISIAGATDYQRVAKLYLQTGDTAKSILNWKKFTDQRGGNSGYEEAIRSFAEAGADDVLATYFKEVCAAIPAHDPARRSLAQALIQVNERTGRYDGLIAAELFSTETKDLGDLARQYLGYFDPLPGLALRRLTPIAARFPGNVEIQTLLPEVLGKCGDIEGAIATYRALPQDEAFMQSQGERYAELIRKSENPDLWRDFALARAEGPNPSDRDVEAASRVLIDLGRRGELAGLRERILANAAPDKHARLREGFLAFDVTIGDSRRARDGMKLLVESENDPDAWIRYYRFLIATGYTDEAAALYRDWSQEIRMKALSRNLPDTVRTLLSSGEVELAWDAIVTVAAGIDEKTGQQLEQVYRALGEFDDSDISASTLVSFMDRIRSQGELSPGNRFVVAATEIQLGRWPAALETIGALRAEPTYTALLNEAKWNVPEEHWKDVIGGELENPRRLGTSSQFNGGRPPRNAESRMQERIYALQNDLSESNAAEIIAQLESIVIPPFSPGLYSERARVFESAGALDKALADIDTLLAVQPENQNAQLRRASLLARTDRLPEALDAWRASGMTKEPEAFEFARALAERGFLDEANTVLEASGQAGPASRERAILRARILQREGDVAVMTATLEQVYADLDEQGKSWMANEFGDILLQSGLWKKLPGDEQLRKKPVVIRALIYMAGQYGGEDKAEVRAVLVDSIPADSIGTRRDALDLAELYGALGRRDDAIRVLNAAATLAPGINDSDGAVVNQLNGLEAHDEAARALLALAERRPYGWSDFQLTVFEILNKITDPGLRDALLDRSIALASTDAREASLRALKSWYGPDRASGTAALAAVLQAPDAAAEDIRRAVSLFDKAGEGALVHQGLVRLSSGEFGKYDRDSGLLSLMSRESKDGNFDGVLDLFLRLETLSRENLGRAWRHLVESGRSMDFDSAEPRIRMRIEAAPGSPRVSELIALRTVLATYKGVAVPALDLAAIGVPEGEREEAHLWANLVNSWAMRPPVPARSWEEFSAPLDNDLQSWLRGEVVPASFFERWLPVWAREVGPAVIFAPADWKEMWSSPDHWAGDVLTEIESPDERTITLAFGSTGWTRIWVNENEVFTNSVKRLYFPSADRFEATLKKGRNRVVVRTYVDMEGTAQSLSIISGAEGLKVCAPPLADARPEAYPEWSRK